MIRTGTLFRAELYDDHAAPYTTAKKVYDANKTRYPDKTLVVTNAHWYGAGAVPVGNYKVGGTVVSHEWDSSIGFGWSGNEQPVMGWNDMGKCENFVGTVPAVMDGKRLDVSGQTAGVKRSCLRTWWGFDADGKCTVEVTTANYTLDEIIDRMAGLGIINGLVLDGSGSSQCYDGTTLQTGDGRTIYSYLLLWFDKEETKMKIYLSPSSQAANTYAAGNTTEQAQANRIAEAAKTALERCGFEAKKAPEGQAYQTNITESNSWGADLHVPIHTNAGGGHGPLVMVYALTDGRTRYAKPVYDALNSIVPTPGTYGVRANKGLYEIANSKGLCVYCECEFHDDPTRAQWIIDHVTDLGEAICKGICEGAGVQYISPAEKSTTAEDAAQKIINAGWGDVLIALAAKI